MPYDPSSRESGASLVGAIVAIGLLGFAAVLGSQVFSNMQQSQQNADLQALRKQLMDSYYSIARNPTAWRHTSTNATVNASLVGHLKGTAPLPVNNTRYPIGLYDSRNALVIPATGLFLDKRGKPCTPACTAANGVWRVTAEFTPLPNTTVESFVNVEMLNAPTGAFALKAKKSESLAADGEHWFQGAGYDIYRDLGRVGIGVNAPQVPLHVELKGYSEARFESTEPAGTASISLRGNKPGTLVSENAASLEFMNVAKPLWWHMTLRSQSNRLELHFRNSLSPAVLPLARVEFRPNGQIWAQGGFTSPSDARVKKDVTPLARDAVAAVKALRGVSFRGLNDDATTRPRLGVIAQEVAAVLPELVAEGDDGTLSVEHDGFTAVFVEALKAQAATIEALQKEQDALRAEIAALRQERSGRD